MVHAARDPMSERDDMPAPHARSAGRTLALQSVIVIAAIVLLGMAWVFTLISIDTEQREARLRAEGSVSNLALAVEWQLNSQLQAIDQTLLTLADDWKADPVHFDPNGWRRRSALPGDVSLQVYLLDTQGFVMSTTRPDQMRVDMSDRDYFQAQRSPMRKGMFVGPAIRWKATGRWEINLSRRLERSDGSFAGAIVVTYDPWALTGLLEQVDLGARGLIALVGGDGAIRALVSPGEVRPGEDIGGSEMFKAAQLRTQGDWTGPSAPDRVTRIHAFRRLRDQDLTVVIGIALDEAMRTSTIWSETARLFAIGVTVLVALMAFLLVREVRSSRGRELRLDQDRSVLEDAYRALGMAKASAEAKTAQLQATLSGMSDGVMMLDADLCLVQWNDRFPACTGVPAALLRVGVPMADLLRGQAASGEFGPVDVEEEVRRRLSGLMIARNPGQPTTIMSERIRPDGSTLELRRSALPGGGFVTLYTDITARKRTEEAQRAARRLAEEAAEQKSRFVAIVSHEIRTPLNAVVNSLALLDQSGLSTSQRRLADTARQAGDALMELVHDILELSKMEAGQLQVRPTVFELRPVLDGVQEMFRAPAGDRGIRLRVEMTPEVPEQMRADAGRLRQVLMNFVSNAAKFSQPGIVELRANTAMMAGQRALMLSVSDQGPRIPESDAAQLFQPFSRLDNARQSGAPGTGLGLAICERLTRLMGGQIGLDTASSGGNRFWIAVPLEAAAPIARPVTAPVIILPRRRRAAVLLVEDIPANHLVTSTILRREGHRVDIAESGAEAIRLAASRPYDLIFMDLMMPGMNGYEATRRIRALPPPSASIPIVALTANTASEDRDRCLAAGMNDMIGKPVRPAEMFDMIARTVWPQDTGLPADRPSRLAGPPVAPLATPLATTQAAGERPPAVPALDETRLADLQRGLPVATMLSLLDQCLADMRRRVITLRDTLTRGSAREIEEQSHAIAGMAGTYGLAAIDARMRVMMAAARLGDVSAAVAAGDGMETDLAAAADAIHLRLVAHAA